MGKFPRLTWCDWWCHWWWQIKLNQTIMDSMDDLLFIVASL